ncbi:FAD-dependent oxidoreductase [Tautonia sociabilis]|uniref:FAD-dependent oxidoreductase n=1 Tax=Tautonia sociabilis TaxID=2080755 RepID=A0A432MCE0_9BACT|nr:FAD-dependent oxidoreductase [Tautonia sociabilis]
MPALLFLASLSIAPGPGQERDGGPQSFDVVVYGGTSAGIAAAVQADRMGKSVVVVSPDVHLGGLSSGGLGWTDSGRKEAIGGLAREFYHRVWRHYQDDDAWRWQSRAEYGNKGQGTPAIDGNQRTMWIFEPHVAEEIFEALVAEHDIPVVRDAWLDRESGVEKDGNRIVSITTIDGRTFSGKQFIDATYEGDLMAAAGVSYTVGRESNATYGETLNGVQTARAVSHQFDFPVDPYVVPGDPSSGLLPRIHPGPPGEDGQGDHRVQAYCFRMCLTDHPDNRLPFEKPEGYDPAEYELLGRYLRGGWKGVFNKFDPIPNRKTDTNNHGAFSTDNIGRNDDYPEASYERRREIIAEHERYQKGLMYFLANDPGVPEDIRSRAASYGLARDEFVDNGHWPHQIYVREARRMVSDFVMTERHLRGLEPTPDPVGMGSYNMDSHNVQRYVDEHGHARNEGDIQVSPGGPYSISYRALVPRAEECVNLLVPVCLSSSHIAYGSIRMEPVFMILGQSAATASCLAIDHGSTVQAIPPDALRDRLLADGQVLDLPDSTAHRPSVPLSSSDLDGVVLDDTAAELVGAWPTSSALLPFVDLGYRHDADAGKGTKHATFRTPLEPGRYEVLLSYTPNPNRASNVPITIRHAGGPSSLCLNQRRPPSGPGPFHSLGTFPFAGEAAVEIRTEGTDGHVIIDAVQFLPR